MHFQVYADILCLCLFMAVVLTWVDIQSPDPVKYWILLHRFWVVETLSQVNGYSNTEYSGLDASSDLFVSRLSA